MLIPHCSFAQLVVMADASLTVPSFLPLLNALALVIVAYAFWRWRRRSAASSAAAAPPLQVKPSRYASVSSADFAPKAAAVAAAVSPAPAPVVLADLNPADQQAHLERLFQSKLHCTTARAFQMAADMEHRQKQARLQAQQGGGGNSAASAPAQNRLHGEELVRAGAALGALYPWYDGSSAALPSLQRFQHVLSHTHCIFAKKARAWGSPSPVAFDTPEGPHPGSVTEQTRAAIPALVDFTLRVKDAYPKLREYPPATAGDGSSSSAAAHDGLSFSDPSSFFTADTRSLLEWSTPLSEFGLDAFVVEVVGSEVGDTVARLAGTVREVLTTLSAADPVLPARDHQDMDSFGVDVAAAQAMAAAFFSGIGAASSSSASSSSSSASSATAAAAVPRDRSDDVFSSSRWHFSFLGETFFVTCFASAYPSRGHARYMFCEEARAAWADGAGDPALENFQHRCFVLLQPELSFLRHNLTPDTPHTNWDNPRTERDRIRAAFNKAGRAYHIPHSVSYPTAHFIVPPLDPFSGHVVKWWQINPQQQPQQQPQEQQNQKSKAETN